MTFNNGLEGVVAAETVLSEVDGEAGRLVLRGHRLPDIAGQRSVEWLIAELWRGFAQGNLSEPVVRRDLAAMRVAVFDDILPLLSQASRLAPIEALRLLVAAISDDAPDLPLRLTATVAVGLAATLRARGGAAPVPPDATLGHTADLLRMLRGAPAAADEIAALETYLLSAMDHGLNASTFTARVVSSTAAGLASSVTAALCALKGPLHGGAPGPVIDMLDEIGTPENAEAWLDAAVVRGDRLMGFGHRVYRVTDPRSDVVKAVVESLGRDLGRLRFAEQIEQAALAVLAKRKPARSLQTNLEFYTALLLEALQVPRDAFTGVFACARVAGWVAHALEQGGAGRLIRPQSVYVGPLPAAA
ncbi:MAG TPA: citrate synthase/methylcitrate synthase [Acetobacteraceae bacterium]|nr:citrate synthase/methylcitrate synthase [Acetobacteraceae bacterium]